MPAPGKLAAIFGAYLCPTNWSTQQVTFNGTQLPLLYASLDQIDFEIPYETPAGTDEVMTIGACNSNFTLNEASNPATPGDFIVATQPLSTVVATRQLPRPSTGKTHPYRLPDLHRDLSAFLQMNITVPSDLAAERIH